MNQLTMLHREFDELQLKYGEPTLNSIYGAGLTTSPKYCFVFMNPTGRNVSAVKSWTGLRAPWIGTKQVWDLFYKLNLLSVESYNQIRQLKAHEWTPQFSLDLYNELANHSVYVTNLAKCTQVDARPLSDSVFKQYLNLFLKELEIIKPQKVITFGNQVSSIVLGKQISVSSYIKDLKEILIDGKNEYAVYPTYYPVGQGRRNLPLSIARIRML